MQKFTGHDDSAPTSHNSYICLQSCVARPLLQVGAIAMGTSYTMNHGTDEDSFQPNNKEANARDGNYQHKKILIPSHILTQPNFLKM